MKINQNTPTLNFKAIKLSNFDYISARNVAMSLKYRNIDVLGKKQLFISNDFLSKQKYFDYIRKRSHFTDNQCGFVFLPWSKEYWILGDKIFEQELYKTIKTMDSGAIINLLL